jgi:hypothetical protein
VNPVPGCWYLETTSLSRMFLKSIDRGYAFLSFDEYSEGEIVWPLVAFSACFKLCEDLRFSYKLERCPNTCPTCFSPRIELAADRAVQIAGQVRAKRDAQLLAKKQRAARARLKARLPDMVQVIQTRKAR